MRIAKSQIAWLQAPSIAHNFSDSELEKFTRRYGRAGLDEVRMFPGWGWDDTGLGYFVMPFKQSTRTGQWLWKKPDYRWDDNIKRLRKILWNTELYPKDPENNKKSRIRIRYSYIDHCLYKVNYPWNFWKFNASGPKGMYDASDNAFDLFKEYFDRLWDLGIKRFDLGNEIRSPWEGHPVHEFDNWIKRYAIRHIEYLVMMGAKPLFTFSAHEPTAHRYRGWILYLLGKNVACQMIHGAMIPERIEAYKPYMSVDFKYGLSCDGLDTRGLPLWRQGLCIVNGAFCDSSVVEHKKSCKVFHDLHERILQTVETTFGLKSVLVHIKRPVHLNLD